MLVRLMAGGALRLGSCLTGLSARIHLVNQHRLELVRWRHFKSLRSLCLVRVDSRKSLAKYLIFYVQMRILNGT